MENSKIILGIILIVTIVSCKKNDYVRINDDVYQKKDSLFIKSTVPNMNKEGDSLSHFAYSVILEGKKITINDLIDINTFSKQRINHTELGVYYEDKKYLYIYNESPIYFPELNAIKYYNDSVHFFGYDYYKIDNKIYFQSLEVKNANHPLRKVSRL